jgi:hypothetical protein
LGYVKSDSDAVLVDLGDLNANSTIKLSARTATTLDGLAAASYIELSTWNTSGQHIIDKQTLEATGLADGTRYLQLKLEFTNTNYINNPTVNNVTFRFLKDADSPDQNASNLKIYRSNGGTLLESEDWLTSPIPYFTWDAGHDNETSIGGYCVYLGTSAAADPIQEKGLLGISPVTISGASCPFIINALALDGASESIRGASWLTSSSAAYYINIKAIDAAGNPYEGSSLSGSFHFDNAPPTLPTYFSLPGGYVSNKAISFTWPIDLTDGASDDESGLAGLQYRIGAGTWYGDVHNGDEDVTDLLTNDGMYTMDESADYPALEDGVNFVYMRALDLAGNATSDVLTGTVLLNTVAPSPPENLVADPSDNTENEYSFSWSVPATYAGNAANLTYCYVVNALPSADNCNYTEAGVTSLASSAYATQPWENTMNVAARDEAGNINYALYDTATFTYSGTAPGIPLGVDVSDVSVKSASSWKLAVTWEAPTDLGTGISYYKLFRAGGSASCNTSFGSFSQVASTLGTSYVDTGLTQQNYSYCIKACDSANNCSAQSTTVIGYPDGRYTTPPVLISSPYVDGITTRNAVVSWVTDRPSDTRVAYGFSSGEYFPLETSLSTMGLNHSITLRNLSPGTTYFFTAKWIDEDGNIGNSSEMLFRTLPPPTVQDVIPVYVGLETAQIQFTVRGAASVKVYYGADLSFGSSKQLATSTSNSTYTIQLTGLKDATTYNYRVVPIDLDGVEYVGTAQTFTTPARPVISNAEVTEVAGRSSPTLSITWESNVETTSVIEYFPNEKEDLIMDLVDPGRTSGFHKYEISGLFPSTDYVIRIKGRDYLGNEASANDIHVTTAADLRPPILSDIKTSTSIISAKVVNVGGRARITISWTTDEPAMGQVEYGLGASGVYQEMTQLDSRLTFDHTALISDLEPSSVYHLRVTSLDAAGNVSVSGNIVVLTPKAEASALNTVLNNLLEIFSFAK